MGCRDIAASHGGRKNRTPVSQSRTGRTSQLYDTPKEANIQLIWLEPDGRTAPYPGENPNSATLVFRLGFEFILPTP